MLLQPGADGRSLVQKFPAVLADNARIHTADFDERVKAAGGRVWRIPPYCAPKLSPLDNGAVGILVRYMHVHAAELAHLPVHVAIDKALRKCCSPEAARWCFYNCRYR